MNETTHTGEERLYSIREVSVVLLTCLVVTLLLDAGGLRRWADTLKVGRTRDTFLAAVDPLDSFTSELHLDYPRDVLQRSFYDFTGKEPEAGFVEATSEPYGEGDRILQPGPPFSREPAVETNEVFSPSNPLRVLLIGDSMMGDGFGTMIVRALNDDPSMVPDRHFKHSSGLSRPDFYNWPAQVDEIFAQNHYDAVIVMMGTNDAQGFEIDGAVYHYGDDEWFNIYFSRVDSFIRDLCGHAGHVYWIGMPPMRSPGYNRRMQSLNEVFEDACRRNPRSTYVSTVSILGDAESNFTAYLSLNGRQVSVRGEDGIHMTRAGGKLVSDKVMSLIRRDFKF